MFRYQNILVPLDGSELAERAITPAVTFANAMMAEIILLTVVTPLPPRVDPYGQALRKEIDAAKPYLELTRSRFLPASVAGKVTVSVGAETDQSIVNFGEQNNVDLIVMSSHGRFGPSRWLYGSVAEKVLRGASCDTAIIRAQVDIGSFDCKRILLPLDGSPSAEQALEPAVEIAGSLSAELILLCAVTLPHDRGETVSSPNVYELMAADKVAQANSYLQRVQEQISNGQLQIQTITAFGRPPAIIIGHANSLNVNLIVMSSRGHSGIRRWLSGSVTEKVLCGATCATLVVREQVSLRKEDLVRIEEV
jgi:nucleotide-binding universal stress UspA family protein